ncbi:hypothetical protein [Chryseobacterium lacus]|uniref:hypothetical protein n=1 Tax=Chryseobacterium lacus TaxID=2058346 RepID=UPI000F890AF4|nr:hypothetical protein [Chryseobacterium lacus]RST28638.1 hypothetical protein EIZ46_01550 [Chryseobacterium lacus]
MALILLMQIDSSEVLKTMLLAGIGGASSYLCTLAVRVLLSHIRKKSNNPLRHGLPKGRLFSAYSLISLSAYSLIRFFAYQLINITN